MNEPAADVCWMCRERTATVPVAAFAASLCATCSGLTAAYDTAWDRLSKYLHAHWPEIGKRGSFDLSKAFGGEAVIGALHAHLYFVKLMACKLSADKIHYGLATFAAALTRGVAHPEVTLLVASCAAEGRKFALYDSAVSLLRRDDEVYSAMWTHLAFPVAVKVCYLKSSAPVDEPEGFPWHPTRQRKLVKLSPYKGDTRPLHARRDLRL